MNTELAFHMFHGNHFLCTGWVGVFRAQNPYNAPALSACQTWIAAVVVCWADGDVDMKTSSGETGEITAVEKYITCTRSIRAVND